MDIELPDNFPFEKPPKKGEMQTFLVDATPTDDSGKKWSVDTIDGVPMNSAGKANAPGDEAEPGEAGQVQDDEAAESPEEEASEQSGDTQATGAADEQPEPTGGMDTPTSRSVGGSFAAQVMGKK